MSPVKDFLVAHLMPEKCYVEFFINSRFHVPCSTFVLNKIIGVWILLDVVFAQLLQLLKILWRRNADGLSLACVLLQLYASSGPVLFAMAHNFPLFAWGERLFLTTQTAMIVFLILHYRGDTIRGMLFVSVYAISLILLGLYAPAQIISAMHSSSLAALIASKVFQARTNYRNGHTGQLSPLSVFLTCAASLGLVCVSLQDTGNSLATASYIVSACFSCVLLAQILSAAKKKIE
ncbi:mannose-P-dolichol utilization defect 1 protein-like isoform X1 [Entelurus aequoreus]|uniref:mannose-P-dolichol utilization defect 1 protein-like isoform X1 n=1 Tax=Entelurus aequoreus TaxID=161455 RepID=UPI002B1D9DA5|nr:mannose-P-dolichol utilization defect 1 protein-like isoform X1 [Entelurus aequoreus]